MSKLLLWEKWRPRTLEETILLPRIRKQFENGVSRNYIFYGHFGTGKTTLARILIGKYSKDKAYLELNASLFTSIDVVRSKIEDFCRKVPMLDGDLATDIKFVFLDEFERMSAQAQDSLKAFIEKYHENVRFILTTNHLGKISEGIKSRFTPINFDCESLEEEKFLKTEMYKRIMNVIVPGEGSSISKEQLASLITKKFPDFRNIILEIQNFIETGTISETSNISQKLKTDLYKLIFDKKSTYNDTYHFLMNNFGPEKIDVMMKLLERPFIEWYFKEGIEKPERLFKANKIVTSNLPILDSETDPLILGMSVIGEFKELFS